MHRMRTALLGAVAITQIGGCAVGSQDFSCPDVPNGMACTSTREVYDRTDGATVRTERPVDQAGQSSGDGENAGQGESVNSREPMVRSPMRQKEELPIREPAQVMRIWVAPWRTRPAVST